MAMNYEEMSAEALEILNNQLGEEQDKIRAQRVEIKAVMSRKIVAAQAVAKLSAEELAAVQGLVVKDATVVIDAPVSLGAAPQEPEAK